MFVQLKRLGMATLPLALLVNSAGAQYSHTWNGCGGNIFNTCASVQLLLQGTQLTVSVLNLSGTAGTGTYAGTVFTGIGFDNLNLAAVYNLMHSGKYVGASTQMTGPTISGGSPAAWVATNDQQIGGGINLDLVGTTGGGIANGIASDCAQTGQLPGGNNSFWASYSGCSGGYTILNQTYNNGWVSFSFDVGQNSLTQSDIDNATLLVKGQNGPNGQSTEFVCAPGQCVSVTPEPVTLLLLGTGLAGIGAARRRRRKSLAA